MNEGDFQSLFTKWIRTQGKKHKKDHTFCYELKITKTNKFEFSKIQPHQIPKLLEVKHGCVHQKISDQSLGFKPFDGWQTCFSPAYLIILFYQPRQPKIPIWIDVDDFVAFQAISKYKYITNDQALLIGKTYGAI